MKKPILAGACVLAATVLIVAVGQRIRRQISHPFPAVETASPSPMASGSVHQSFLYGRVTTIDGASCEGQLRFGGGEEALWSDLFNGYKLENPWKENVPPGQLPKEDHSIQIFGLVLVQRERTVNLARPFLVRFGQLVRLDAEGRDVFVTLKSGSRQKLDRFSASDFDDGVRVWDPTRGVLDLDSLRIRAIEFFEPPGNAPPPARLYGTVRTGDGTFRGFIQWNRQKSLGTDTLDGQSSGAAVSLRFDTIRTIRRRPPDGVEVLLRDGNEKSLTGSRETADGNLGLYVDDPRYGRVLVPWDVFQSAEFEPSLAGPGYADFPPGAPIAGAVTTRTGRRLAGRLVFDLDESEDIETLDAPSRGVDYLIPFGLIASILLPPSADPDLQPATVILRRGEELRLERKGDLGPSNAGLLVFVEGLEKAEYVSWASVQRIDFAQSVPRSPTVEKK
jgi:hypothetical protein